MQSLSRQECVIFLVWMDMVWRPSPQELRRVSDACSDMGLPPVIMAYKLIPLIGQFMQGKTVCAEETPAPWIPARERYYQVKR